MAKRNKSKKDGRTIVVELQKLFRQASKKGDFLAAARLSAELRELGAASLDGDRGLTSPRAPIQLKNGKNTCPNCGQVLEGITLRIVDDREEVEAVRAKLLDKLAEDQSSVSARIAS